MVNNIQSPSALLGWSGAGLLAWAAGALDGSATKFAAFTRAEYEKWTRLNRGMGIRLEE